MNRQEPTTYTMQPSQVHQEWDDLLDRVYHSKARVIVERDGVPVAAIISPGDLERLKVLAAERVEDFAVIHRISRPFQDVPADELEREVARALADVRAEGRREDVAGERHATSQP